MEKEAYERARKLDTDTINRQEEELDDLRKRNDKLTERVELVQTQNRQLNEDVARVSKDNYQLHRENTRILEVNEQVLAENRRLREQGERVMRDNNGLHLEVDSLRDRVTRMQRGMDPDSTVQIRERENDTNPMMERLEP